LPNRLLFTPIFAPYIRMRFLLLLAGGLVGPHLAAQSILFQQDFSASPSVASYVSATPSTGQFTSVNNTGANSSVSIVGGGLQMASQAGPGSTTYFNRSSGFTSPGSPAALLVQFDFEVINSGATGTNQATFFLGSNLPDNGSVVIPNSDVYARLGFNFQGGQTTFGLRNISGNQNSAPFSGRQRIRIFTNNSGATLGYTGPNGSPQTLTNDQFDVWVGNTRVFAGLAALTPAQTQNQMRFIFQNNNTTIWLDNFLITDDLNLLPVHLLYFNGRLTGQQPQLNWAATGMVAGTQFAVQRSATGHDTFVTVGHEQAGQAATTAAFQWTDGQPLPGANYYRLAISQPGQTATFSRLVRVEGTSLFAPQLRPNPASDWVQLTAIGNGNGQWQLYDNQGVLVQSQNWAAPNPAPQWSVAHLRPGLYFWRVSNGHGQSGQGRLLKQ
jgi:hypothetical protein